MPKIERDSNRIQVPLPVLYGADDFVGQGTLLSVLSTKCRIAGNMPVKTGMSVWVWVYPPFESRELFVEEARVIWQMEGHFALQLVRVPHADHSRLLRYAVNMERRANWV